MFHQLSVVRKHARLFRMKVSRENPFESRTAMAFAINCRWSKSGPLEVILREKYQIKRIVRVIPTIQVIRLPMVRRGVCSCDVLSWIRSEVRKEVLQRLQNSALEKFTRPQLGHFVLFMQSERDAGAAFQV